MAPYGTAKKKKTAQSPTGIDPAVFGAVAPRAASAAGGFGTAGGGPTTQNLWQQAAKGAQVVPQERVLAWSGQPQYDIAGNIVPGSQKPLVTQQWQEYRQPLGMTQMAQAAQQDVEAATQQSLAEQATARRAEADVRATAEKGAAAMQQEAAGFDNMLQATRQQAEGAAAGFGEAREYARDVDVRTQEQVGQFGEEMRGWREGAYERLEDTTMTEFSGERIAMERQMENDLRNIDRAIQSGQIQAQGGMTASQVGERLKVQSRMALGDNLRLLSNRISSDFTKMIATTGTTIDQYTGGLISGALGMGAQVGMATSQIFAELARSEPAAHAAFLAEERLQRQARGQLELAAASLRAAGSELATEIMLSDQYLPDHVAMFPVMQQLRAIGQEDLKWQIANQAPDISLLPPEFAGMGWAFAGGGEQRIPAPQEKAKPAKAAKPAAAQQPAATPKPRVGPSTETIVPGGHPWGSPPKSDKW